MTDIDLNALPLPPNKNRFLVRDGQVCFVLHDRTETCLQSLFNHVYVDGMYLYGNELILEDACACAVVAWEGEAERLNHNRDIWEDKEYARWVRQGKEIHDAEKAADQWRAAYEALRE